ncbi:MAG: hypothetical protein P4L51_04235 [Puia sp.]|nr:hypothetical protein [Puia sp.]
MRKTLILLFMALCLVSTGLKAQSEGSDYKTALGLKYYPGALTLKHFIQDDRALEGLLSFWNYGFRVTGLYEFHAKVTDIPGMKVFLGPGAHIGSWNGNWLHDHPNRAQGVMIGIDGIAGLDYKFNGAPIDLSLDAQPALNIIGYTYVDLWGGIAIRYTF